MNVGAKLNETFNKRNRKMSEKIITGILVLRLDLFSAFILLSQLIIHPS